MHRLVIDIRRDRSYIAVWVTIRFLFIGDEMLFSISYHDTAGRSTTVVPLTFVLVPTPIDCVPRTVLEAS